MIKKKRILDNKMRKNNRIITYRIKSSIRFIIYGHLANAKTYRGKTMET